MASEPYKIKVERMHFWSPDLSAHSGPKYQAIAAALLRDIEMGRLQAGDRLPPQRTLAETLSVDLTTVTKAYNEVRRLGLIEGGGSRGSFVRGAAVSPFPEAEVATVETGMNLPPDVAGGSLAGCIRDGIAALLAAPNALTKLQYQPSGGALAERAAGAAFLQARGIDAPEDRVLVTSGSQSALHGIVATMFEPGDAICTGAHVYPGFLALARRYGLELVAIESDEEGLVPAALQAACRRRRIKAVYVVPTNDNPTAATMALDRRRELAEVAGREGVEIIEDDAYGLLPVDPIAPIAALAADRIWHISSLSKIVSPALRVAYVRAPAVRKTWRLAGELHQTAIMAPPLNAALASRWVQDGQLERLVAEIRGEAVARQRLVREALGDLDYRCHPEGYHLWLPLPGGTLPAGLVDTLRPAGLSVVPSEIFAVEPERSTAALRVSIGGSISRERLARALRMLDAMLAGGVAGFV
jgi:DNA-binding transcriptional MocR family regulator